MYTKRLSRKFGSELVQFSFPLITSFRIVQYKLTLKYYCAVMRHSCTQTVPLVNVQLLSMFVILNFLLMQHIYRNVFIVQSSTLLLVVHRCSRNKTVCSDDNG